MALHHPTPSPTTPSATSDSMRSHATENTAPTSVDSDDRCTSAGRDRGRGPGRIVSPEEWSALFLTDEDRAPERGEECPDGATLAAVRHLPLYDAEGETRTFGSLYETFAAAHPRQLIVFVRHFYCGACQAYLQALTDGISLQEYFTMPVPTSIIIIGCGQPDMIRHYKTFTRCAFPIFADPSRSLFRKLGMKTTWKTGLDRPDYMRDISPVAWFGGQARTMSRSLRDPDGIRKRDLLRGGNPMQIGGEFLFEDGRVKWCHRMRHYRDHTEIADLRRLLGLNE